MYTPQDITNITKQSKTTLYRKKLLVYENTIAHTKGDKEYLRDVVLKDYRKTEERIRRDNRHLIIEPLTREEFSKATAKLKLIIVNKDLVKINASEEDLKEIDEIAKRYEKDNNNFVNVSSFFDFLAKYYLEFVRDDANGFLVVRPENADNNLTKKVELTFDLVYTYQILSLKNGIVYKKDDYIYSINNTHFQRFYAKDTRNEEIIEDTEYKYTHNLGYMPFVINGGVLIKDTDHDCYYESFISHSLSYANLVIKTLYDSEFLRQIHAHPTTVITEMPCTNPKCNTITGIDRDTHETCTVCRGKGKIVNFNMGATIVRKANDSIEDDKDNKPFIEYISPPLDGVNLQKDGFKEWQNKLRESLSLNTIDEAQSGTAKEIDERTNQISVNSIAKNIYGNLEYILNAIVEMLNYANKQADRDYEKPTISYPNSFYFQNEESLLTNIDNVKKSGISGTSILFSEKSYTDFKFSTNEVAKRTSDIALWYDTTSHLTDEVFMQYTTLNVYNKKDLLVRLKLPSVLYNLSKQENFMSLSDEEVRSELDKIFNEMVANAPVQPVTDNTNNTQTQ